MSQATRGVAEEERQTLVENLVVDQEVAATRPRLLGRAGVSVLAAALAVGAVVYCAGFNGRAEQAKPSSAVVLQVDPDADAVRAAMAALAQQGGGGAGGGAGVYGAGGYAGDGGQQYSGVPVATMGNQQYGAPPVAVNTAPQYGMPGAAHVATPQQYGMPAVNAGAGFGAIAAQPAPADWVEAEQKAQATLATLNLTQKISLLHGAVVNRRGYAGWVGFNPGHELGFNDGPQGYNTYGAHKGTSTQLPCLLAVAASFDPAVSSRYATVVAEEFIQKKANVLLGPDVEILRAPLAGRGYETLSGEDPYLGAQMVAPFVQAVQALGIIACVKHWLDNNSEDFRMSMSVSVDSRTQREIYTPVFKAAFDAGAAAVMCSYNKVSGIHSCENKELLTDLLRNELNFRGFVISDWGGTHDALRSLEAGLDIDMQTVGDEDGKPLEDEFHRLPELLDQGTVTEEMVDEKARHVLAAMYRLPNLIPAGPGADPKDVSTDAHRDVATQTIIDSAVLLKNENGALPLDAGGKTIAFVGKFAKTRHDDSFKQGTAYASGGSGYVQSNDEYTVTPLEGMKDGCPDCAEVFYAEDAGAASRADVAIVVVSAHSEEGWDRKDLTVPDAQELVSALKGTVQKVIVVALVPGPVETDWVQDADAAMLLFMPGERLGVALARLLTGQAGPGGRLPVSMPKTGEVRFTPDQYPGDPFNDENMVAHFTDGVLVGYRWNDVNQPAAYPFGFGLAYTELSIENVQATCGGEQATVTMQVSNKGAREGYAVPQVYVGFQSMQPALRTLKGFQKVLVQPGASESVTIVLGGDAFRYFNEAAGGWQSAATTEQITISVGTSSADLPFQQQLQCA